jgi:hypothetical protein
VRTLEDTAFALAISAPVERLDRDQAGRHLAALKLSARVLGERLRGRVEEPVAA